MSKIFLSFNLMIVIKIKYKINIIIFPKMFSFYNRNPDFIKIKYLC